MAQSDRLKQRALLARAFLSEATRMIAFRQEVWSTMPYPARARYQTECLALAARTSQEAEEAETSSDVTAEDGQLWLPIVRGGHPSVSL
jgi:hypothetical protein